MYSSTLRLLKLRIRLWWNTIKHRSLGQKIGYGFAMFGLLGLAGFILFLSWGMLRLVTHPDAVRTLAEAGIVLPVEELLALMPVILLFGAFFLGLLVNFGALLQTLYLSGDMEFLLAAPIPPRAVFASKMVQAVIPSLLIFSLFTGPSLLGLGISQEYTLVYFLAMPLFLVLLVVSGGGLSSLLVMAVVRVVSPKRASEVLAVAGGMIGLFCSQIGNVMNFSGETDFSPDQLSDVFSTFTRFVSGWNPAAWPGLGLDAIGRGDWVPAIGFTFLTLSVTGGLLTVTFSTAQRLYFSGWARVQVGTRSKKKRKPQTTETKPRANLLAWLPGPAAALVLKDSRVYRRDIRNISQLISPIIVTVFWSFFLFRGSNNANSPGFSQVIGGLGGLGLGLFIAWTFAMRFGLTGFSLEGKQWWILKTSPISRKHLVLAKYMVAYLPSLVLGELYLVIATVIQKGSIGQMLYQMGALAIVLAALSSLMLTFGILGARFDWDNPNQVTSSATGCIAPLAGMAFMGIAVGAFVGLPILGEFLEWSPVVAYLAAIFGGVLVSGLVGILPLWGASSKIPKLG